MKKNNIYSKMDKPLLIMTLIYACIGVLLVLSASSVVSVVKYNEGPYYFFIRQVIFYTTAFLVGFIFVLKVPTKVYKNIVFSYLVILIIILIGLLMYGQFTNNARSWINFGLFSFQPSEFIKLALILYLGIFFGDSENKKSGKYSFLIPLMLSFIVFILIVLQPDLGTASVIASIVFFTFMSIPMRENNLALLLKILAGAVVLVVVIFIATGTPFLTKMQKNRFTFQKPCTRYTEETGYQACNGFIAMNGGGLFGKGIGKSTQKYLYLPEAHTDFIFPIAVEELGAIFGIAIILGYLFILFRIIKISKSCYELKNSIICYGVVIYIFTHLAVNFGGILALLPLTGIPVPFLSYGGSFTLNLVIALFIVQRINIENNIVKRKIEISSMSKK